jgi:hypothetical protein
VSAKSGDSNSSVGNVTSKSGDSNSTSTSKIGDTTSNSNVGNVTSKSGDSNSTSKVGNVSSGSSSATNGNQSTNVTIKGNISLPNYAQMGSSSVTSDGGSYTTPSIGVQGYVHEDGDGSNPRVGILAGITIPVGVDRAKKAQDLAIQKAKNANMSQLIQMAISLKQAGYTVTDTPETHQLYIIMQSIR